ncbi:MAG: ketoacyl-ACP synthase III [Candidatus Zixiibacteriota bacterium]|nr:MAG: ketoacyl-ACP synthase III [candidate division Zixibacteria bacterium]
MRAKIIGTGSYVPPDILTNADFEKMVDTSDEWIVTRTGIRERHIASNGCHSSDMAVAASKQALEMAGCSGDEIDLLIVGTVTPDYRLPSTACVIQEKMHLPNAVGFDIVAACTGFINGLSIAAPLIEVGRYSKALVIGVEKLSSFTNYADRNTCVLFGDAAGAAVVSREEGEGGVLSTFMKSDGNMRELLWAEVGGTVNPYSPDFSFDGRDKILMNGSDVFKVAVKEMGRAAQNVLDEAGLKPSDIAMIIPHQANIRIIDALAKRLKVDPEKVYINIDKYGNTSAASVPLALDQANRAGKIKPGDNVLMVAFGGGLIWGAALVRW